LQWYRNLLSLQPREPGHSAPIHVSSACDQPLLRTRSLVVQRAARQRPRVLRSRRIQCDPTLATTDHVLFERDLEHWTPDVIEPPGGAKFGEVQEVSFYDSIADIRSCSSGRRSCGDWRTIYHEAVRA